MSGIHQAVLSFTSAAATGWSFVAAGTAATGTNPSVGTPAGFAANDLLIICGASGSSWTAPAGWTVGRTNAVGPRLSFWYKIATGAEGAEALTNGSTASIAVMLAYRGVNATPLDVLGTSNTTLTTTSLTTTVANDLVISLYATSTNADTWTSTPASTTVRFNSGGTAAVRALLVVDELKAAAGATSTRTATAATGGTLASDAISFKPA